MNVWSEVNKVINATVPVADTFNGDPQSDIINMKNYNKCTFLVMTGAAADNTNTITVQAGTTVSSCSTDIVFKYRKIVSGDTHGALTTATTAGFSLTASTANQYAIVEVDAAVVAAAGTNFCCVACTVTEAGSAAAQVGCVVAILSEPRYPQAILESAIV